MCPPCELVCCAWDAVYTAWGAHAAAEGHGTHTEGTDQWIFSYLESIALLGYCWCPLSFSTSVIDQGSSGEKRNDSGGISWAVSRPKTRSHDSGSRTSSGFPVSVYGVASALLTGSQGLTWHHLPFSIFLRGIDQKWSWSLEFLTRPRKKRELVLGESLLFSKNPSRCFCYSFGPEQSLSSIIIWF